MPLTKRYCVEYLDGTVECFRDGGFWYTDKGQIIKWSILGGLVAIFLAWFLGGYIHAKRRLKNGLPLLRYHRFLISYQERRRHGQVPIRQNDFSFYQAQHQQGYYPNQYQAPPPMYNAGDAPPGYFAPPGATKVYPNQNGPNVQMQGMPGQQSGIVGGQASSPVGNGQEQHLYGQQQAQQTDQLPPRPPQQAKAAIKGLLDRFKR